MARTGATEGVARGKEAQAMRRGLVKTVKVLGLTLAVSVALAAVVLLLFNGWMGWELVYRRHVGVSDETVRGTVRSGRA